jgi:hypothetical protein
MTLRSDLDILQTSLSTGYTGGGYYNPVEECVAVGRLLTSPRLEELCKLPLRMSTDTDAEHTFHVAALYQELISLVARDEVVFPLYDTGRYKFAVYIYSEERLIDFEVRVAAGALKRCGFLALDREQANKGLRRDFVQSTGLPGQDIRAFS